MKEKWELFKISLTEEKTMSKKEWLLVLAVCVLSGIVLGMLFSPRKTMTIASHNGSNNGSYNKDKNKNNSGAVTTDSDKE